MGTGTDILKWMGGKAADGVKAGGKAANKQIKKSLAERQRKKAIYEDEFNKVFREEEEKVLRQKAREDAMKRLKGE